MTKRRTITEINKEMKDINDRKPNQDQLIELNDLLNKGENMAFKKKEPTLEPSEAAILTAAQELDTPADLQLKAFDYVEREDGFHLVTLLFNPLTGLAKVDSIDEKGMGLSMVLQEIRNKMAIENQKRKGVK